jgi:outer membrane receptor protein involved in Fe transport
VRRDNARAPVTRLTQVVAAALLCVLQAASLRAQAPTAAVTGIVQDSTLVPLPGADIRAIDRATGFGYRASAGSDGRYWLNGLPPGRYDITAERLGWRTATVESVEVTVGRSVSLDFTLHRAPVPLQPITVRARKPLLDATGASISHVLDRETIERVPEESRSFIELARLVPGTTAGAAGTGALPSFGTRGSIIGALNQLSSGVFVDGGDFTEAFFGDLGASIPLLAVQEFAVQSGPFGAEHGRAASGIVNVATRRGGGELEIEAFGLYRHHRMNARSPFESEKPDFNRSHWGIAAGGPLASERTRFFAAFERRVQHDFATVNTGGAFPDFEGTFETPLRDNLAFARIDHRVNDAHELTLRYAGESGRQLFGVGGPVALEYGQNNRLDMHSGLLAHRWVPAPGWLNEARLHVIAIDRELARNAPPGPSLEYPSLRAGPNRMRGSFANLRVETRNDLSRVISSRTGTHRIRLGAHLGWQQNETETFFFDRGVFRFGSDTATAPTVGVVTFSNGAIRLDAHNVQLGAYAQDDWSPLSTLTVTLGLRYDLETNGSNQGFVSPFAEALPFVPDSPRPRDADNIAPRIGVSWEPIGHGRMVVRGGFGVFYDALFAVPLQAIERSSGVRTARILDPMTTDVDALRVDPDTLPPTVWTQGRIETPFTRQYSLGLEATLPADIVVRVDGLLIEGRNLLLQRELNPVRAGGPPYPGFASVLQVLSEGRASAKMVLVGARKASEAGWFSVAYTLADRKNTNDTWSRPLVPQNDPDRLDLDAEWGPAAWDERHRLVVTGGVRVALGFRLVAKTVYASARPYTAVLATDVNGDTQLNDRSPGEGRNARRGPDYFRTDLGFAWSGLRLGSASVELGATAYNLFNGTNGVPSSVQAVTDDPRLPPLGQPLAAFPGRQVELGVRLHWR